MLAGSAPYTASISTESLVLGWARVMMYCCSAAAKPIRPSASITVLMVGYYAAQGPYGSCAA